MSVSFFYTTWQGQKLTIWQASIFSTNNNKKSTGAGLPASSCASPGIVFDSVNSGQETIRAGLLTDQQKLAITCGKDNLIINELQLAGKKKMTATEFLRGHSQIIDSQLQ
ncbi:MAG: hypothetical protein KAS12_00025 [Candidatus Aenigmarchaeota archaeon]|nr:hypothetical protein [Candidatus Aenigmarchaeota archaeon]